MSDLVLCPGCRLEIDRDEHLLCPACHSDLTAASAADQPPLVEEHGSVPVAGIGSWRCASPGCQAAPPLAPTVEECPFCFEPRPSLSAAEDMPEGFELRDDAGSVVVVLAGSGPWRLGREESDSPELSGYMTVSRSHALLSRRANNLAVRDLGSSNRTFVGHVALSGDEERIVEPGSTIGLGKGVVLRVLPA